MSKFMPSATPFQIDESVGGKWLIVSPETQPIPWGGLIPCYSYADAEATRDALNGVVSRVTEPRDAEIARLTAELAAERDEVALKAAALAGVAKQNDILAADLEREQKPWSVTLVSDGEHYGEHSQCEVIDIGYADRILLVRCEEVDRLTAEVTTLRARCMRYERCLRRIASEDYRGNRPMSAIAAEQALKEPTDG